MVFARRVWAFLKTPRFYGRHVNCYQFASERGSWSISVLCTYNWATSWQNQQNDCAPSEDWSDCADAQSDQSLRCALNGFLRIQTLFMRTANTLIGLGGCPGWSESSLCAQSFCWFCHETAHMFLLGLFNFILLQSMTLTLFVEFLLKTQK